MKQFSRALFAIPAAILVCLCAAVSPGLSQSRINFNNQQVFLNGSNIAWVNFAADLGPTPVDTTSFKTVFDSISAHGGNALRFWLHTTGANTPAFSNGGAVIGPGTNAIADLKRILDMAWQRRIGLLLTLWSFDMLDTATNPSLVTNRSELMLTDTTYTRYYINNALIPMVNAVKGHPAIIGWEIFNEAEGMSKEFGWSTTIHVPMSDIQTFVNLCAGAIHRTDPAAKVTTGAWALTVETDVNGLAKEADLQTRLTSLTAEEKQRMEDQFYTRYRFRMRAEDLIAKFAAVLNYNYYRDDRLIQVGGDPLGTLDFYTDHYYDWQSTPISPFVHPYSAWQLTKPLVIGEFFPENTLNLPFTVLYDTLYANGYAGGLSWGWYSGAAGHNQDTLKAHTVVLVQDLFSRYPEDIDPDPVTGRVYSFTAKPGLIDSGQTSTLDWKTALGTSVTLDGNSVGIRGTVVVSPTVTTHYRLITSGAIADTTTDTVFVYPSGRIISFTASATHIGVGDPVELHWNASHGSTVSLNDSTVGRTDSLKVFPPSTTTYRLTTIGSVRDTSSILITAVAQDQIDRALLAHVVVSGSSTNPAYKNPANMIDGDTTTQWVSASGDRMWIDCNLGQSFLIKRVVIRWGSNYATSYRLELSPNDNDFTLARAITGGLGGTTVIDSINLDATYIEVALDVRALSTSGFAVRELEVYGIPTTLAVADAGRNIPDRFALSQNYPNPFNPSTTITYGLPKAGNVSLVVYDVLGREVATLVRGTLGAGYHTATWDARSVASGVYFARLVVTNEYGAIAFNKVTKLVLMK